MIQSHPPGRGPVWGQRAGVRGGAGRWFTLSQPIRLLFWESSQQQAVFPAAVS